MLAASSSAIALSIVSPTSCDSAGDTLNEPGSSKESVWKAAYGAARVAVEIAKDSSDMLPPLKAVMVALSVLIKNYDVGSFSGVSHNRSLTVSCSKPPLMRNRPRKSRKGFIRLVGYSRTLLVIKTVKRRRGERPSGGSYRPPPPARDTGISTKPFHS